MKQKEPHVDQRKRLKRLTQEKKREEVSIRNLFSGRIIGYQHPKESL